MKEIDQLNFEIREQIALMDQELQKWQDLLRSKYTGRIAQLEAKKLELETELSIISH